MRAERQRLSEALAAIGLTSSASQANFLLVQIPAAMGISAAALYQGLKQRHILVRYFDQPRLDDKLRITIGTSDENAQLLKNLKELLPAA